MLIKPLQIRTWAKLGMEKSLFGIAMDEVLANHPNTYVVTADLCGYSGMDRISRKYPDKIVNVGIQEQGMLGVASGLALEGKMVFAGSYGAFAVARAMEQVRHNMSILHLNIKLIGYSSGYSKSTLGRSHWATEDIALTRCLPNMTVISPADALEAVKACIAVAELDGPAYIRLSGGNICPIVYKDDYAFQIGKGICLRDGTDTAILATGRMVNEAMKAAEFLEGRGISARVINIHTIKPLDEAMIFKTANEFEHVFTVEEHNIVGGLGSAVAEIIATSSCKCILHRIGMKDCIYKVGSEAFIWRQAELFGDQIAATIIESLS